jgi:hypothetical protein
MHYALASSSGPESLAFIDKHTHERAKRRPKEEFDKGSDKAMAIQNYSNAILCFFSFVVLLSFFLILVLLREFIKLSIREGLNESIICTCDVCPVETCC